MRAEHSKARADRPVARWISLLVCRDGLRNLGGSIGDLMDRVPVGVDHERMDLLIERVLCW